MAVGIATIITRNRFVWSVSWYWIFNITLLWPVIVMTASQHNVCKIYIIEVLDL